MIPTRSGRSATRRRRLNGKAATGEVDSIVETDDGPGIVKVRFVLINKRGGFKDHFEEPPEPETQRLGISSGTD